MGARFTRGDFRDEKQWRSWVRDCRAVTQRNYEVRREQRRRQFEMQLKHDASLVGLVVVIPREYVSLRWTKREFLHLLESK